MRRISNRKLLVAGVATVVIAGGASAALAYWSSSGSGTGSATVGTSSDFVVTVDAPTGGALTPGGPTDAVAFHVKNTNSGSQNFSNAVATVTGTSNPGCDATDFSVSDLTAAYGDLAPNATADGAFNLQMIDKATANQDACKGATVNLRVDVS